MRDSLINVIDSLKVVATNQGKDTLYVLSISSTKDFIDILPLIIAALALLISCFAAYISKKTLDQNKLHQRLSVVPALNYFEDFALRPNCEGIGFLIKNVGIGPALIKDFILSWGDIKIYSQDDFSKIPNDIFFGAFEGGFYSPKSIIDKSEAKWIIRVPLNYLLLQNGAVDMDKVNRIREELKNKLSLKIIYRSFYDEEEYEFVLRYNSN